MEGKRRILMIGNKNSGKTTYMASAYGIMKSGKYGFYVSGDEGSDEWLMHVYSGIKRGGYPVPSDKRSEFSFDLFYLNEKILSFEWIDYFGGVITDRSVEQLGEDIDSANAIMLFLDAEAMKNGDTRITQFRRIQSLITEKLSRTDSYFDIIVILTKYDTVEEDVAFEDVCKPLENFKACLEDRENINFKIVPVSCTQNGFVNVDLPLMEILYKGLLVRCLLHYGAFEEQREKVLRLNKKRGFFDWAISRLLGVKTNGEMCDEGLEVLKKEGELVSNLCGQIDKIKDYIEKYPVVIPSKKSLSEKKNKPANSRFGNM